MKQLELNITVDETATGYIAYVNDGETEIKNAGFGETEKGAVCNLLKALADPYCKLWFKLDSSMNM